MRLALTALLLTALLSGTASAQGDDPTLLYDDGTCQWWDDDSITCLYRGEDGDASECIWWASGMTQCSHWDDSAMTSTVYTWYPSSMVIMEITTFGLDWEVTAFFSHTWN